MKSIRIGCGAGCSFDRIEPAVELIEKGNLDYIIFECLAERTIANDMQRKMNDDTQGYTPMLEERFNRVFPLLEDKKTKIITNMGSANVKSAVNKTKELAKKHHLKDLKIAYQYGDEISDFILDYEEIKLVDENFTLTDIKDDILSANIYFGYEGIVEALNSNADIVLTGRIADASLFVGPIIKEFNDYSPEMYASAVLLGHLLECAGQLTGGYFANPGFNDVEGLAKLGFPIAEIFEDGSIILSKVEGSGGVLNKKTVTEQLFYEITNPAQYITPNGVVDFSQVTIQDKGNNIVYVSGAKFVESVETYKVNIGYHDGYIGSAEVSFGGANSLRLAQCCQEIVEGRWEIIGMKPAKYEFSYIGYNSLYSNKISQKIFSGQPSEVRLRLTVKDSSATIVTKSLREIDFMYTNGPAGAGGIRINQNQNIGVTSIIIPKSDMLPQIDYEVI